MAGIASDYHRAAEQMPFIGRVEQEFGLPHNLLYAVGSRETGLHNVVGDHGHGHGVWQLDDRSHHIPPGFDRDPEAQARTAAAMLHDLHQRFGSWEHALNAYNSGHPDAAHTTGHNYGPDVLDRLHQFNETEHADHTDPHHGGHAAPPPHDGGHAAPPPHDGGHAAPPAHDGGHAAPPPHDGGHAAPPPHDGGHAAPPPHDGGHAAPPPHDGGHAAPPPHDGGHAAPAHAAPHGQGHAAPHGQGHAAPAHAGPHGQGHTAPPHDAGAPSGGEAGQNLSYDPSHATSPTGQGDGNGPHDGTGAHGAGTTATAAPHAAYDPSVTSYDPSHATAYDPGHGPVQDHGHVSYDASTANPHDQGHDGYDASTANPHDQGHDGSIGNPAAAPAHDPDQAPATDHSAAHAAEISQHAGGNEIA